MTNLPTCLLSALALALASSGSTPLAAQESAEKSACAQLLPAVENLRAMLVQETKVRTSENETQRMQLVVTLLTLRYRNIEALEASLRTAETEEEDVRSALVRGQAQIDALEEAAKSSATPTADPERKAQRAEIDANVKGLEERARGLAERKANYRGQLALERHDIEKLEAAVRGWLEKTP